MVGFTQLNAVDVAAALLAFYLLKGLLFRRRRLPLPPGPPGLPLIGNLLDLPKSYNFKHWAKYKQLYGPISSLSLTGQVFIIINDQKTSIELLEKRSANYCDRPPFHFGQLAGWGHVTTLLQYGNELSMHRKNIHRFIGAKDAIAKIHPIEESEGRRFLVRALTRPRNILDHVRLLTGATILKVSHGYEVDAQKPDVLIGLADTVMVEFSLAAQPGRWLVDILPILKYVPSWLPGAGFQKTARQWKKNVFEMAEIPHEFARRQMLSGVARPSFEKFLMEKNPTPEEEFLIKWSALTLYAGAADTSVSAIYSFFIAMQLFPEVQRKAQAELDAVIGHDRLPTFADRPRLPYIDATVKEVFRWNTVVPLCVPHVAREDDEYKGYFIPKGAQVITNIWGINHDPEHFHDADSFKPERFLGIDGREPEIDSRSVSFGYGRRICPGKELANATIFIAVAMCLSTLNISKARDQQGREIEPVYDVTDALISYPKPFSCTITARSAKARELIMAIEEENLDAHNDSAELSAIKVNVEKYL